MVTIDARAFRKNQEDWIRIRVIDTGIGMNEEQQAKLFTRFYTTKKSNASGTGLGLVISQGLGELMGGRVFLEKSAPGDGSTFTVEIPRRLPSSAPTTTS